MTNSPFAHVAMQNEWLAWLVGSGRCGLEASGICDIKPKTNLAYTAFYVSLGQQLVGHHGNVSVAMVIKTPLMQIACRRSLASAGGVSRHYGPCNICACVTLPKRLCTSHSPTFSHQTTHHQIPCQPTLGSVGPP